MTTTPNADPQGQTPNGTDPQGQTPTTPPSGQTPNGNQRTSLETLPSDIQDYIKSLRADAKKYRDASESETRAKQAAEEARLAEQGQFKELAAKHEAKVKELEPISQRYSVLATQINATIEAETKDWPAEVKSLIPGIETPVESRLEQMARLRPLLAKLQEQAKGTQRGNSPNPSPTGQAGNKADAMQRNRQAFVKQRNYGI